MSAHHANRLLVHAIEPARLNIVRTTGEDAHGNQLRPFAPPAKANRCVVAFATPSQASRSP